MSLFAAYSRPLAGSLLPLLDLAGTIPVETTWVPKPFSLISTFTTSGGIACGTQGLVLTATLPVNGSPTPVAILVLASRWADFFYGASATNFTMMTEAPGYLNLSSPPSATGSSGMVPMSKSLTEALGRLELNLAEVDALAEQVPDTEHYPLIALSRSVEVLKLKPLADGEPGILQIASKLYNFAQAPIWEAVTKLYTVIGYAATIPLICVGIGPASLTAQLAALDLRPGQTGPSGATQKTPASDICCYTFSTSPIGNTAFTSSAQKAVPGIYTINATGTDLWPDPTGLAADVQILGNVTPISVPVASSTDTPWYDRTPAVYGMAFGYGPPTATGMGTIAAPPVGFDLYLASALAELMVSTYALCQHPNASVSIPQPYKAIASVFLKDQSWTTLPWAVIYANPIANSLVIAIRGPSTMGETGFVNGPGFPRRPIWLNDGAINAGVLELADLLATPLAQKLAGQSATSIYYVGHDYGASIAAVFAYQAKALVLKNLPAPTAIYGFGCQPFGTYPFTVTEYGNLLGASTYQVQRSSDVLTRRTGSGYTYIAGTPVSLAGGETATANSTSYHASALYSQLLNQSAG